MFFTKTKSLARRCKSKTPSVIKRVIFLLSNSSLSPGQSSNGPVGDKKKQTIKVLKHCSCERWTWARRQAPLSHLKTRGLRLRCALVEVGHRLSVEVHPGIEIRTGGLLRSRTCCLACKHHTRVEKDAWKRKQVRGGTLGKFYPALTPGFVVFRSAALGLVLLTCWQRVSQYSFKIGI